MALLAAASIAALAGRPASAAEAPSWRIAGSRATPLHVRVVQRLRDHDPEGRARLLELDALIADEGQAPWTGGSPVLEGRASGDGPWMRIAAATGSAWLAADGSPWPPAPEDSLRTPRLRVSFEGDSLAAAGLDGPWRLTFATVPEGETGEPVLRWYEAFTAPLRAMQFGRTDWFVRGVERVRAARGQVRVRVAIESSIECRASFRLRALAADGRDGAAPVPLAERPLELALKSGMNRVHVDLSIGDGSLAKEPDRPLRFEVLDAESDRRLWPR